MSSITAQPPIADAVVDASTHFMSGLRIDFTATAVLIGVAALLSLTLRGAPGMRG